MPLKPYNEQAELDDITFRYTNALQSFPKTLRRLQCHAEFLSIVKQLYDEGWRDWHILQAIYNGIVNWYAEQEGIDVIALSKEDEKIKLYQRLREEGEHIVAQPIPVAYFTLNRTKQLLDVGIASFLQIRGAIFRDRPYNFSKLRKLAQQKYHYLELDVPHSQLFLVGTDP